MEGPPTQVNVAARHQTILIIWASMLTSIVLYAAIAYFVRGAGTTEIEGNSKTLLMVFLVLSLSAFGLSFVVKRSLLARAISQQRVELVQSAYVVAFAISEAAAIFGLLAVFTTSSIYSYLLFIISALGTLLHMPRRDDILAASGGVQARKWPDTGF
jgi:hypothetical protein